MSQPATTPSLKAFKKRHIKITYFLSFLGFVVLGIISKNHIYIIYKVVIKVKNQHVLKVLCEKDYRVATLSKSYLTVKGIIIQRLKLIEQL